MYYKCPTCSNMLSIPRQIGRQRGKGHKKDLWCPFCKEDKKFVEMSMYY